MPISVAEQVRYGSLGSVIALGGIPLYLYAPDFYAAQRGLDLALIGILLLILRLLDAFTDPLWGYVGDRWARKRGTLYLFFALLFLLGMWALFSPPAFAGAVWFFLAVLFASAGYSYLTILLNSMASLRADSDREAVTLTTSRESFVLLGLMLAALAPPLLTQIFGVETGYHLFVGGFLVVGLIIAWYWHGWLQRQQVASVSPGEFGWQSLGGYRAVLGAANKTYLIYGVSALASACPAVLFIFFVRDYLQAEQWTGVFLFVYFVAGVIGMPLWRNISHRLGLDVSWLISMMVAIAAFSGVLFIQPGELWLYALICLLSGLAFGADLAMPSARLVGDLARDGLQSESSRAFALMAFLSKLVLAISAALLLWALDRVGFVPAAENTAEQLNVLAIGYGGVPILLKIIAAILLFTHLTQRGACADENNRWKTFDTLDSINDR